MADMLTIGASAASSYKLALDVTSHNVANVSTEGYSRQRAEIVSNTPGVIGGSFLGGGSKVDSIIRISADFLQSQLQSSQSLVNRYDSQLSLSKQVEGLVASNDQGVQEFMQRFFDALQTVASNPTSNTSRQQLLDEATNLESHIGNLTSVLGDTQDQVNGQITGLTDEVNSRLETIQAINIQVERSIKNGTQLPNDLLDQRDQAILELSKYIDIKTYPQEDGRIDIHTGNGKLPLLSDNTLTRLQAELSPFQDENRTEIYMTIGGQKQVVSQYISGGQLGGVLDFRTNMLDKAQNDLGLTLNGLVASMNWQSYQGYDINGAAGGNMFTPLSTNALGASTNTEDGSGILVSFNPLHAANPPYTPATQPATYGQKDADFKTALGQVGQFVAREYEIKADGANYTFYDHKTGEVLTAVETVAGSNVFQLDGLEFDLSGQANVNGDKFLVKPHQQMLEDFTKAMTDPSAIAARGQSPLDSNSDGSLLDELPAAAAVGDNVNMANMASLQSAKLLFADSSGKGAETLLGGYSKMATNVGMYVRGSEVQLNAQNNVFQQLSAQRDSIAGVSLDEEAANLIKFQQAYEASAQIIAASQSIFQTLLGAMRG